MHRSISTIALLAVLAVAAPAATAQPDRDPHGARDAAAPDQRPEEFIRHRIETLDAERERLSGALQRLEAGEDWEAVRGDAFADARREGGFDRKDWRSRRGRMNENFDEAATLESLSIVDPEAAGRYDALREENPRVARRLLQSSAPRLHKLEQLREKDPDLYEVEAEQFRIDRQIMHLAWSMHAAISGNTDDDAEAPALDDVKAELHTLISRQVDLQIEAQQLQLESAQGRIESLSDRIDERVASRDAVIADRVDRIMERAVRSGAERRQRGDRPPRHDRPRPSDNR